MGYVEDDYDNYWETNMLKESEFDSCLSDLFSDSSLEELFSSSPVDVKSNSVGSKNIVSERNRRKVLNERLYSLRSVVPNITKMDKASIIKDGIKYIESLQEEERKLESEIKKLESSGKKSGFGAIVHCSDKPKRTFSFASPLEVLELRVSRVGEKTMVVSLICNQRRESMAQICDIFESLKLKLITSNITAFHGKIHTIAFLEGKTEETILQEKIKVAIAAMNDSLLNNV